MKTLKDQADYLLSVLQKDEMKVNFAVFDSNKTCVKLHKYATLMELLQYVSWNGFRCSVDQILLKIKYIVMSGKDSIYNIHLADDFNLNILVLKDTEVKAENKLAVM
jgi:hypothetical protein